MSVIKNLKTCFFAVIVFLCLLFVYITTYNLFEPKAYDFMIRHSLTQKLPFHNKQIYGSNDIVLVVIDSKTVEKYRWPWKRDVNCKIFEFFLKYAKRQAFFLVSILATLD